MGRKAAIDRIAEWSGYARLSDQQRHAIEANIQKELGAEKSRKKPSPT